MVPEEAYSSSYLREEPLDKSYDFISQCATHGYQIRWAGLGAGGGGVQRCGWLAAGLTSSFPPAPPAHLPSAAAPPPPSRSSTTMGLGRAAATRWAPWAPHVSLLGASVPAAPTSSAATAPAVPPATGASPIAGVSTPVLGVPRSARQATVVRRMFRSWWTSAAPSCLRESGLVLLSGRSWGPDSSFEHLTSHQRSCLGLRAWSGWIQARVGWPRSPPHVQGHHRAC